MSLLAKFDDKILRGPLDLELNVGSGGFRLRDAVSWKRCERAYVTINH